MSTWSLNSVGAKYDTAKKGVVTSEVKFNLWKKGEVGDCAYPRSRPPPLPLPR